MKNVSLSYFYKLFGLVLSLSFLLFSVSFGAISIHIEKGMAKPYPVALVPFGGNASTQTKNDLLNIIDKDLLNSGRFDLLAESKMPQKPDTIADLNLHDWAKSKVEFVIIGQVNQKANNSYDVSFYLISQLGGRSLIGQAFKDITQNQMRALAHHISDLIYQGITGFPGYFSTKLAYIEILNPYQKENAIYKLVVSDYDGFNPQTLLKQRGIPIASPAWSPNGRSIAYVSYIKGRMAIFSIDVTTGKRKLISNLEGINSAPSYAPNNQEMALALSKGSSYFTNIYLFNLEKHQLQKLTSVGINTSPTFAPNGKDILFTSNRSGLPQVYQLAIGSDYPKRLTFNGVQNMDAQYTPNGKNIVFMHQEARGGQLHIAKQTISNGDLTVLTDGNVDKSPSISPNGQMIIYTRQLNSGKVNLAMVSIDGQVHLDLPATEGNVQSPAWSPFL